METQDRTPARAFITGKFSLIPGEIEILRNTGTGNGFSPDCSAQIDSLERKGLVEVKLRHPSSSTGRIDRIGIRLTHDGERVVTCLPDGLSFEAGFDPWELHNGAGVVISSQIAGGHTEYSLSHGERRLATSSATGCLKNMCTAFGWNVTNDGHK